jgi:hypothetical protein
VEECLAFTKGSPSLPEVNKRSCNLIKPLLVLQVEGLAIVNKEALQVFLKSFLEEGRTGS